MSSFSWALTHLGADEACVLDQYTKLIEALADIRGGDTTTQTNAAEDAYGWHNCPTIVNPDPTDGRSLAEKCEALPDARAYIDALYGSCGEWAQESLAVFASTPVCSSNTVLATAWIRTHHGDTTLRGARFD